MNRYYEVPSGSNNQVSTKQLCRQQGKENCQLDSYNYHIQPAKKNDKVKMQITSGNIFVVKSETKCNKLTSITEQLCM